jgi:hypothetical protein
MRIYIYIYTYIGDLEGSYQNCKKILVAIAHHGGETLGN